MKIKLNKKEYTYLCKIISFSNKSKIICHSQEVNDDIINIELTEDQADEIRDNCSERLQLVGFDEKYELNQEGVILESLIDKFFIG